MFDHRSDLSFYTCLLIYILKGLGLNQGSYFISSMSNAEKIEVAEQRIIELKTLISHWKTSNISSRRATSDLVEAIFADRQETKAA